MYFAEVRMKLIDILMDESNGQNAGKLFSDLATAV